MQTRRGIAPVLYHLHYDDAEVGDLRRTPAATIALGFQGFPTSTLAASAAWLAYSGRLAYEAQFAALAADGPERFPAAHRRRAAEAGVHELVSTPDGAGFRLRLDGDEIARLAPVDDGTAGWRIELGLGPADTPVVFALAAARRMWQSIHRAGVAREMTQWSVAAADPAQGGRDDAPFA